MGRELYNVDLETGHVYRTHPLTAAGVTLTRPTQDQASQSSTPMGEGAIGSTPFGETLQLMTAGGERVALP